ncbi:unnamed protein product, partial [Arabidopsis halleri]
KSGDKRKWNNALSRESEDARERESFFADPPCLLLAPNLSVAVDSSRRMVVS